MLNCICRLAFGPFASTPGPDPPTLSPGIVQACQHRTSTLMRQVHRSLSFLAACARQQKSLAAAVAVAQPGSTVLQATATAAAGLKAASSLYFSCFRTIAVSAAARQAVGDLPDKGDSYYWLPPAEEQQLPFTFDRRGIHERRATSK
jgi:hypothetical protein